jgi:ketosteroid isomerase-like protein
MWALVRGMKYLLLALALSACASAAISEDRLEASPAASPAPVIAAERAFAARAGEVGWIPAFREYTAPDGEIAQPSGYASATAELAETPDDGNRNLFWWPAYAGISRDAGFGFTTGPVSFDEARTPRGHYFTVWRRQPDGSWKWIYDGGVGPIAEPNQIAPDVADVPALPVATTAARSADAAIAEVRALEQGGALAYAADARRYRTRTAPMTGAPRDAPEGIVYNLHRVEAASSGDLVMVLGTAQWSAEGGEGLFARMWQRRAEGWRIVYDQLVPPRPPPAAN